MEMVFNEDNSFFETDDNRTKKCYESLMDKYNIPVQHFEYSYIEKCKEGRELEKIVEILRSGEEGYFPDLTKFAENRLAAIKPKSKLLRQACPVISKNVLNKDERNEITNDLIQWVSNVSKSDDDLAFFKKRKNAEKKSVPRVRQKQEVTEQKRKTTKRISSTDYSSWEKYDPDTEILKMDLEEENVKKTVTEKKKKTSTKKTVQFKDFTTEVEALKQANYEKDKGNEFFKAGDYEEALEHYSNSINCKPTLASFTNRALTHIKLKNFQGAINDCHSALAIDPDNIKALVRKAQALDGLGKYAEALEIVERAIEINPNNILAQELAEKLRKSCGRTPKSSTRFVVQEVDSGEKTNNDKLTKQGNVTQNKIKTINESKNNVIIPIPGTSTMSPPHYITCSDSNFKKFTEETKRVHTRAQIIHMISVDNSDIDDDDCCTINHLKTSKDICNKMITSNNSKSDLKCDGDIKHTDLSERKSKKTKENISELKSETSRNQRIAESVRNVNTEDKRAGGEPCITENENFNIPQDIHSPYSFLRTWNAANSDKSLEQHALILRTIDINRIVEVIGCKLDSSMFSTIIRCLSIHFAVPGEIERLHFILENIVNLPRFGIISMLMSSEDRNCVNTLVNFLKQHGKTLSQNVLNKLFNYYYYYYYYYYFSNTIYNECSKIIIFGVGYEI